ncbi:MAG TPA: hypothetical protein VI636_06000 [Candidatus Angelobacter sp.]
MAILVNFLPGWLCTGRASSSQESEGCAAESADLRQRVPSFPVARVFDRRPFGQGFKLAMLQPHELGMDGEAGLDIEVQGGLVLKLDGQRVVIRGSEEMDFFGDFPFDQRKFDEAPVGKRPFTKRKLAR